MGVDLGGWIIHDIQGPEARRPGGEVGEKQAASCEINEVIDNWRDNR
jgi:hypothetical protein